MARSASVGRTCQRWAAVLILGGVVSAAQPATVAAQTSSVVSGRVIDSESGAGLANALVTLEGHGSVLSSDGGFFRFQRVPSAEYALRVEAFGYEDFTATVEVTRDTTLVAPLEIVPIILDSIRVALGTIDFDGRVRDPRTDSYVADAEVRSDQGHSERTSLSGRFDLDDVFDGPPLRLVIRAFRYMPLDTTFVPDDEERYPFDMAPDPVMTRMIDRYVARLDERAGERMYEHQAPLNRSELARFSENTSLQRVMEARYPLHIVRRIRCFILDEREYRFGSEEERISVFEGTVANDLERIEVLEFPGEDRLFMARVYTRRFFQRHVASPEDLDPPSMVATPGGVFCR